MTNMFGIKKRRKHHEEDYEKNQATAPNKGFFSKNPSEGKEHMHPRAQGYSKHEMVTPKMEPHMKSRITKQEEQEEEDDYHTDHVPTKQGRKQVAIEVIKRKMKRY